MSTISTRSKKEPHTSLDQKRLAIDVVTCDGRVTPMFLFKEFSFLDEELKDDVHRYCLDRGWIPFIDYDTALKSWIFHSITFGDRIWKKPIAEKYVAIDEYRGGFEAKLARDFSAYLRSTGLDVRTQVRCAVGIADIVTDKQIYELKYKLDRSSFFRALGQVLLYRESINPHATAVLVCRISVVPELHEDAKKLGVEVCVWTKSEQAPLSARKGLT